MAKAATYKVYTGSAWEELTFKPSSHSHDYITNADGDLFGFNDCDEPVIVNKAGRFITVATDASDGNYLYYTFPEKSGTIALLDDIPSSGGSSLFNLIGRQTLSLNGCISIASAMAACNEIMIVVRIVTNGTTYVGIAANTSGSSGFLCSVTVTGTTYIKLTMNKTSEGYYAWTITSSTGSSFGWATNSNYIYLRNYSSAATSVTMSAVMHGR